MLLKKTYNLIQSSLVTVAFTGMIYGMFNLSFTLVNDASAKSTNEARSLISISVDRYNELLKIERECDALNKAIDHLQQTQPDYYIQPPLS